MGSVGGIQKYISSLLPCRTTNIADFNTDDVEMAQLFRAYLGLLEDVFCQVLQQAQAVGELSPNTNPRDLAKDATLYNSRYGHNW